ncbi:MAG TPA: cell wall-binding repeat-containing protein [Nocardioidaceae bacterium]|nr:cell wall-binding repeat-containing protein [Nocardioidaceae bacterium]
MSVSRRSTTARAVVRVAVLAAVLGTTHPAISLSASQPEVTDAATSAVTAQPVETELTTVAVPEQAAETPGPDAPQVVAELENTRTQDFGLVGVTWALETAAADLVVQIRTRTEGAWTAWEDLEVEEAQAGETSAARGGTSPAWVGESDGVGVRLLSTADAPQDVEVVLIDGGTGLATKGEFQPAYKLMSSTTEPTATPSPTPTTQTATATSTGGVPQPTIVTRKQWGVDTSTQSTCSSPRTSSVMKGIVLHHTAGANGYSREESPGIVRGIHRYHTQSLGWCDIGYNFLVDAYGTIYQGRRGGILSQVRGAHAGNWDANMYTTGISMMGNFEEIDVPRATRESVVELSAWRLYSFGLDAVGKVRIDEGSVDIISGHRDIYTAGIRPATATACPGRYGYAWLNGSMRYDVQAVIDAAPEQTPAPTPSPSPADGWQDGQTPTPSPTPTPTPTKTPTPTPTAEPTPTVEPAPAPLARRLSGDDRYATAAAISRETFTNRGGAVFLAAGRTYADALSGGPAAAGQAAPVLLSKSDTLPDVTVAELQRLAPSRIYILGGEGALSTDVEAQAGMYAERVVRLAGVDRYETGVVISSTLWSRSGVVYLASGSDYPDALSGGALAARRHAPMLLAGRRTLADSVKQELARLNPEKVVILGGTGVVSSGIELEVGEAVPGVIVTRLAGKNRYATSAAIADAGWRQADVAYFAAGSDFPDALAGVPAAGLQAAPLLLTRETCMPRPVAKIANALAPDDRVLLGGSAVLQDSASKTTC